MEIGQHVQRSCHEHRPEGAGALERLHRIVVPLHPCEVGLCPSCKLCVVQRARVLRMCGDER